MLSLIFPFFKNPYRIFTRIIKYGNREKMKRREEKEIRSHYVGSDTLPMKSKFPVSSSVIMKMNG